MTATVMSQKSKEHKIGILGHVKLLVFKLGYGHVGGLAAVGLYFAITQLLHGQQTTIGHTIITFPDVKGVWDGLLSVPASHGGFVNVMSHSEWTTVRHLIRPLYEGIFGGLLFAMVAANPFKANIKDEPGLLSKIAIKSRFIPTLYKPVTGLQIVALPFTITLFSLPGVALGYGVDQALRALLSTKSLAPVLSSHPSVVEKFYAGSFDAKVIGLFASAFFASRVAKPVFYFILRYYAQRRVLNGKRARFFHPPAFKLLVREYGKSASADLERKQGSHSTLVKMIIPSSALIVLASAGLGYYVLRFVAGA